MIGSRQQGFARGVLNRHQRATGRPVRIFSWSARKYSWWSSGRGDSKAIRGAVEQCDAQTLLKERNASPDRNLPDTQNAGGSRQAARARHGNKEAHIIR